MSAFGVYLCHTRFCAPYQSARGEDTRARNDGLRHSLSTEEEKFCSDFGGVPGWLTREGKTFGEVFVCGVHLRPIGQRRRIIMWSPLCHAYLENVWYSFGRKKLSLLDHIMNSLIGLGWGCTILCLLPHGIIQ